MFLNCVKDTLNYWALLYIDLGFFKNYHKDIKTVCKEYEEDFWYFFYFLWALLSFKSKYVMQVFITDIQVKIWKSFLFEYIFVSVCTSFWVACL